MHLTTYAMKWSSWKQAKTSPAWEGSGMSYWSNEIHTSRIICKAIPAPGICATGKWYPNTFCHCCSYWPNAGYNDKGSGRNEKGTTHLGYYWNRWMLLMALPYSNDSRTLGWEQRDQVFDSAAICLIWPFYPPGLGHVQFRYPRRDPQYS